MGALEDALLELDVTDSLWAGRQALSNRERGLPRAGGWTCDVLEEVMLD